ncbi:unnamed protein product [Lathyrus sativus]|nr:unnamed protein product [Lathyrus sativus]
MKKPQLVLRPFYGPPEFHKGNVTQKSNRKENPASYLLSRFSLPPLSPTSTKKTDLRFNKYIAALNQSKHGSNQSTNTNHREQDIGRVTNKGRRTARCLNGGSRSNNGDDELRRLRNDLYIRWH